MTTVSVTVRDIPTPSGTGEKIVNIIRIVSTTVPNLTKAVDQEAVMEVGVDVAVVDTNVRVEVTMATAPTAAIIRDPPKVKVEVRVETSTLQAAPLSTTTKEAIITGGVQFYHGGNTDQHYFDAGPTAGPNQVMRGREESCHEDTCPGEDCIPRKMFMYIQQEGPAAYGNFYSRN